MAFNFPSSPTNGQTYTSGGTTYTYNGYGWAASGSGSYTKAESDTNFVNVSGDTMTGTLKINNWLDATEGYYLYEGVVDALDANCRWGLQFGAGVSFEVARFSSSGVGAGYALNFNFTTGLGTVLGDPTVALGIATKQYVDVSSALKVAKAGDTMTGNLRIEHSNWPQVQINNTGTTTGIALAGLRNNKNRWDMRLGDYDAETGSNAGSSFVINRFDDAGNILASAFTINRATGDTGVGTVNPGILRASLPATKNFFTIYDTTERAFLELATANSVSSAVAGHIAFIQDANTPMANKQIAAILAQCAPTGTAGNVGGQLTFWTKPDNGAIAQRLLIDQSGALTASGTITGNAGILGISNLTTFGWGGDNNQGLVFLNSAGTRYLHYNGTIYNFNGAVVNASNGRLWGATDFSAPLPLAGGTVTGKIITQGSAGGMATSGANQSLTEIQAGGGAYITLHHVGSHAAYFGLDSDNQLKYGGWSVGDIAHKIWHDGICPNNSYYVKMPSGLMFTWMVGSGGDGWKYFPVAFPNVCLGAVAVMGGGALGAGESCSCYVYLVQTNACYVQVRYANNGGAVGVATQGTYIFAWGY